MIPEQDANHYILIVNISQVQSINIHAKYLQQQSHIFCYSVFIFTAHVVYFYIDLTYCVCLWLCVCVFISLTSERRQTPFERLPGTAFSWVGGALCWSHHPAALPGHSDPGTTGKLHLLIPTGSFSGSMHTGCFWQSDCLCLCLGPSPQSHTFGEWCKKRPWLFDQRRPSRILSWAAKKPCTQVHISTNPHAMISQQRVPNLIYSSVILFHQRLNKWGTAP